MRKSQIKCLGAILLFATVSISQTIRPSQPTHLMYTPTPSVNPAYHLVLGLHEISFALPAKLQLQMSLLDNIGRINFGAKYGFLSNMAVGAGMAYNFIHIGDGSHGISDKPRLGAFLAIGLIGNQKSSFQLNITPHTQIGEYFSVGFDLGLLSSPHSMWSIIWEVGTSVTNYGGGQFYLNTDVGVRINPPRAKFLFFDLGIDLTEFHVGGWGPSVSPYIDFTFAMDTK